MTTAERLLVYLSIAGGATIDELATHLDVSRREIEKAVQELRLAGNPIWSGPAGVRMAATADELRESNERLHGRLREQYRTLRASQLTERRMRAAPVVELTLWRVA